MNKQRTRRRNARRARRNQAAGLRGEGATLRARNPYVVAMAQRNGAGSHGDARKAASKQACRGRVTEETS